MAHTFDLYIDESGDFLETQEDCKHQGFASQIVGVLAPQGQLTADEAERILKICYKNAGYDRLGKEVHGTRLASGEGYDRLITTLSEKIIEKSWQPIRLVNREGIDYGDRQANYVNMVAELALRIFHQKSLAGCSKIIINLYYASVYLGSNADGEPIYLEEELYRNELEYYLAITAVRKGFADKYASWKIGEYQYRSGKKEREMQLCDLLSNASHSSYKKCGAETQKILQDAFKPYDYSMVAYLVLEQCDLFISNSSIGQGIRTLAERLVQKDRGGNIQQGASERLELIINKLSNLTATERNNQLLPLIAWLEQIINLQRSLSVGLDLIEWLRNQIYQVLAQRLEEKSHTLDWFDYALHFWALTAYNHQGNLIDGRTEADRLEKLIPLLAGQWEHITLIMEGLVAEGVHRIDCLEYDRVAQKMKLVANYYEELSSLFVAAFPDVFPERVYSELRGKALGTWLQGEIYAGASDPSRLKRARELSDLCIEEFNNPGDKARQYQYRCHLETLVGDFSTAREYLAKSFSMEENSHSEIARYINTLEGISQGFAILHWLRLGTIAYLDNNDAEWSQFIQAFKQAKLQYNSWCQGQELDSYPTHGILRRIAIIEAIQGSNITALGSLRKLAPISKGELVLGLIQCAAYAEVASFCWGSNNNMARKILNDQKRERLGLKQLLEIVARKSGNIFPQVEQITKLWLIVIDEILDHRVEDTKAKSKLLKLGREISY